MVISMVLQLKSHAMRNDLFIIRISLSAFLTHHHDKMRCLKASLLRFIREVDQPPLKKRLRVEFNSITSQNNLICVTKKQQHCNPKEEAWLHLVSKICGSGGIMFGEAVGQAARWTEQIWNSFGSVNHMGKFGAKERSLRQEAHCHHPSQAPFFLLCNNIQPIKPTLYTETTWAGMFGVNKEVLVWFWLYGLVFFRSMSCVYSVVILCGRIYREASTPPSGENTTCASTCTVDG